MIKDLVVGVIGKQDALCHHVTKAGTREAAQQVLLAVLGDRGCGGFFGLGCRVVNLWQVQSNVAPEKLIYIEVLAKCRSSAWIVSI